MRGGRVEKLDFGKAYAADGTSTLDALKAERTKLQARLRQIPVDIANFNNIIRLRQEDIDWLKSLSNRKRKKWEKEKGKTANEAIYRAQQTIVEYKAKLTSANAEKKRIPDQISKITQQIDTLIQGESTGLEKGIDKETAKELGEIELQKERERMEHERALRETEKQVAAQAQEAKEQEASKSQKNLLIGIGAVILLAVIGWIIYKRKFGVKQVMR